VAQGKRQGTGQWTRRTAGAAIGAALLTGCSRAQRDPHTLVVGASPTGVPFSYVDPASNRLTGAMVDIAAMLATQLGMVADMRVVPFAALVPSLTTGRIDLIAAAMLRTPAREALVGFSHAVFAYAGALALRGDDPGHYPDLRSVAALRVGAQIGTRFVDQLHEAGVAQIATYQGLGDMLRDLAHGRIDAAYGDAPILHHILAVGPRWHLRMPAEFRAPAKEPLCLIARRGSPLLARINAQLAGPARDAVSPILDHWGLAA
jgi:polar amino acid transport system substrate-binding protein